MRLSRTQGYIAIWLVALSFLVLAFVAIYYHIGEANHQSGENSEAAPYESSKWTDIVIMLYTFVLTAAAVGTWYIMAVQTDVLDKSNALIEKANKTADDALRVATDGIKLTRSSIKAMQVANELTRESLLAQIHAERGKLIFESGNIDPKTSRATYNIRNIGNAPAIVRGVACGYNIEDWDASKGARTPRRNMPYALFYDQVIMPGKTFAIDDDGVLGGIQQEIITKTVDIEVDIVFFTLNQRWRYHFAALHSNADGGIFKMPFENWEFEEQIIGRAFPMPGDRSPDHKLSIRLQDQT